MAVKKKTIVKAKSAKKRKSRVFVDGKCDFKKVYLEDRYEKPKHVFIVVADKISSAMSGRKDFTLLDVGGATGELSYYLKKRFPDAGITCLEYDKKLCETGAKKVRDCRFVNGDANDMHMFKDRSFDVVTMVGVMSVFDDFVPSIDECIRVAKNGGSVYVFTPCNEFPVDVLLRWRRTGDKGEYEKGLNVFSKQSLTDHLAGHRRVRAWEFEKFTIPFDLPMQEDLLRIWTVKDGEGRRTFTNGLGMEINLQILAIRLK